MSFLKLFAKKKSPIQRIATQSVTDTIARAMEQADRMERVVIIYETVEGEKSPGGMLVQEDTTFPAINWMLDQAKKWVIE